MITDALSFGQKRSRMAMIGALTAAATLGMGAATARAQERSSCLADIERVMREYQARFHDATGDHLHWAPCCPDSPATYYPGDDYYDDALKNNPALGPALVKSLLDGLLCQGGSASISNAVNGQFLKVPLDQLAGRDPANDSDLRFGPSDFSAVGLTCGMTIDQSNYCEVFGKIKALVDQMQMVWLNPDTLSTTGQNDCVKWVTPSGTTCNYRYSMSGTGTPWIALSCGTGSGYCSCPSGGQWPACEPTSRGYNPTPPPGQSPWNSVFNLFSTQGGAVAAATSDATCVWDRGWYTNVEGPPFVLTELLTSKDNDTQYWAAQLRMEARRGRLEIDLRDRPGYAYAFATFSRGTTGQGTAVSGNLHPEAAGAPMDGTLMNNRYRALGGGTVDGGGLRYTDPLGDVTSPGTFVDPASDPQDGTPVWNTNGGTQLLSWNLNQPYVFFRPKFDAAPDRDRKCGDGCSKCLPGDPEVGVGGQNLYWPLGTDANGDGAGYIQLRGSSLTAGCLPKDLLVNTGQPETTSAPVQVYREQSDAYSYKRLGDCALQERRPLRQISTGRVFVDIVSTPCPSTGTCGFQIRYYLPDQTTAPASGSGMLFTASGSPFYTSCVGRTDNTSVPDPANPSQTVTGTITQMDVYKEGSLNSRREIIAAGGNTMVREGYVASTGAFLRVTRVLNSTLNSTDRQVETLVCNGVTPGTAIARSVEVYRTYAWGESLLWSGDGGSGSELATTLTYYTGATDNGIGQVKHAVNPYGGWAHQEFDTKGRLTKRVTGFLSGTYNDTNTTTQAASEAANRVEQIKYYEGSQAIDVDGDSAADFVEEHIEKLQGADVARWYVIDFAATRARVPGKTGQARWTVRLADASAPSNVGAYLQAEHTAQTNGWNSTANDVSERIRETTGKFRVLSSVSGDGQLTWREYTSFSPSNPLTATVARVEIYSGRMGPTSSPYVRNGTRHVTESNVQGTQLLDETFDLGGTTPVLTSGTAVPSGYIDSYGRATRHSNEITGRFTATVYSCCGVESTTDETGIQTKYEYDALKRVVKTSVQVGAVSGGVFPSMSSITEYDAAGRVTATKRIGSTASTVYPVSSTTYDTAGRVTGATDALGNATVFQESLESGTGLTVRTETLPDPDGTGSLASPVNVHKYYPDGSLYTVNSSFSDATSGAAPEVHGYGVENVGGVNLRYHTRYMGTTTSAPWARQYADSLDRTVRVSTSLTSTTCATEQVIYKDSGKKTARIDADSHRSWTLSGVGASEATELFGGSVPTALQAYFQGRWDARIIDSDGNSAITIAGTSGAAADQITVTGSWLDSRTESSSTFPVRRSATIAWNLHNSSTSVIETSRTDTTLDGASSWTTSFDRTSFSGSVPEIVSGAPTGRVTATSSDPAGASVVTSTLYGRLEYSTRTNADTSFGGKTVVEYDNLGRVTKSHLLRTSTATANSANDDITEMSYNATIDRLDSRTDPSPTSGTTTTDRLTTTYAYDNLGRVTSVGVPGSKATDTAYNARGQTKTVKGFGVNPVDYGYDNQGRMTSLTTYQNGSTSGGAATTTWEFDQYSGRLAAKRYQGNTSAYPDLGYTYTDAGRLATRINRRLITSSYSYNDAGGLLGVTYSDGTTPATIRSYDRLGRAEMLVDAAGLHAFSYTDDGRLISDAVSSDTGITNAPHMNILDGVTTSATYAAISKPGGGTYPYGTMRTGVSVALGSSTINEVLFGYDAAARLSLVEKAGAMAQYAYDPISGQLTTTTNSVLNTSSQWVTVFTGERTLDRLGRIASIQWNTPASTPLNLAGRSYVYDVYGRRTAAHTSDGKEVDWSYGYDDLGQLTTAQSTFYSTATAVPGNQFAYTYDDIGNRLSVVQGDSLSGSNSYSASYTPNLLNQYTARTNPHKIEISGHSPMSTVLVNGSAATRFLDSGSNLLYDGFFHKQLSDSNTGPSSVAVDVQEVPGDRVDFDVLLPATSETLTYDADGNLSSDGIWNYEYDAENRLVAMELQSAIGVVRLGQSQDWIRLEFAYDAMGRRISKQVRMSGQNPVLWRLANGGEFEWKSSSLTKFVYDLDSWNLLAVLSCDPDTGEMYGPDQTFAWGPDLSGTEQGAGGIGGLAIYLDDFNDNGGGTGAIGAMFPTYDGNGNVLRLFDTGVGSAGPARMAAYTYGPFGEDRGRTGPVEASRFPFRWSTKYSDNETGLVWYGYRYYSPGLGQWLTRDLIEEAGGMNLHCSVHNAPTNRWDFLGLDDEPSVDEIEQKYRQLISGARAIGWNQAANLLQHFLDNSGEKYLVDDAWLRGFRPIVDGMDENMDRFKYKTIINKNRDKLLEMNVGDSIEVEDYWDYLIEGNSFTELFYASGNSTLRSRGKFKIKKESCIRIVVTGVIEEDWYDIYDWHNGMGASIPGVGVIPDDWGNKLVNAKRAKTFDMYAIWHHRPTVRMDIRTNFWTGEKWLKVVESDLGRMVSGPANEQFVSPPPWKSDHQPSFPSNPPISSPEPVPPRRRR